MQPNNPLVATRNGEASLLAQGLAGAAVCGLAGIPLAVLLTLIGGVFGDVESLVEVVLVFLLYAVFGSLIAAVMGLLVGLPVYLLLNRAGALRFDVFMLLGAAGGFAVFALWVGAERTRHAWPIALGSVMCGAFCALAFWLGARTAKVSVS